ncbi:hydroxymethylbilane synthase [Thermodesulfobacteriota bacterium]
MILKIGTRASRLALAQSKWVKSQIESRHGDITVELVTIKTTGDKILDSPLSKIGGKGLFVKEIEEALLEERIDLAVHSMKDVPGELPGKLFFPTFPEREDPRDAFISLKHKSLDKLPDGAKVGTSSLRRSAQLLRMRPDLIISPLRGNVDTRIKKLKAGEFEAIILASAGLRRLGLAESITHCISINQILPAIAQGALGIEIRRNDANAMQVLDFLNHKPTEITVKAERAFLKKLEGGCQVPIAAFARMKGEILTLKGLVSELDGSRVVKDEMSGKSQNAEEIGLSLAEKLIDSGAGEILDKIYGKIS